MRYLLLICGDEAAAAHVDDGCGTWFEDMARSGVLISAEGLQPPTDATTVRVRGDSVLLTDGPFAETREQIGGLCVVECDNLDDAIAVAAKHPAATYGTIEIRPLSRR